MLRHRREIISTILLLLLVVNPNPTSKGNKSYIPLFKDNHDYLCCNQLYLPETEEKGF